MAHHYPEGMGGIDGDGVSAVGGAAAGAARGVRAALHARVPGRLQPGQRERGPQEGHPQAAGEQEELRQPGLRRRGKSSHEVACYLYFRLITDSMA